MILSDFRREYGYDPDDVWVLPTRWFKWYLNGLSKESRFFDAISDKSKRSSSKGKGGGSSRPRGKGGRR